MARYDLTITADLSQPNVRPLGEQVEATIREHVGEGAARSFRQQFDGRLPHHSRQQMIDFCATQVKIKDSNSS